MTDHIWSVLCERSIVDRESNNITLQTVREQVVVFSEPVPGGIIPMHMELVSFWGRSVPDEPSVDNARVTLFKPSGELIISRDVVINLSEVERSRNRIIFNGIPADQPGRYIFLVEISVDDDWIQVARVPLSVDFQPREQNAEVEAHPVEA
jgi:hypothetical protein